MKEQVRKFYQTCDEVTRYTVENTERIAGLEQVYSSHRRFFGRRVLDLCCGGGVLGSIVERHGHSYTGVDINPDMIRAARAQARRTRSKNIFVLKNCLTARLPEGCDTITLFGNALCHFGAPQFVRLLRNVDRQVPDRSHFLVDYRDVVRLIYERRWRRRMVHRRQSLLLDISDGCNTVSGELPKHLETREGQRVLDFVHGIWAPFVLESIFLAAGWQLVHRQEHRAWQGWLEVYSKQPAERTQA